MQMLIANFARCLMRALAVMLTKLLIVRSYATDRIGASDY